jgi:polar amino acid transport system substrate-binding protein
MGKIPVPARRSKLYSLLMLSFAISLATAGCGGSADAGGATRSAVPTADVLGSVTKDDALAALLPEATRQAGVVKFASSVGSTPPSAFYAEDDKTPQGVDIEIAAAVGQLLGVRIDREVASFEAILPALSSGKYEVGTGNFGVTEARKKTIDFVTYINDGQGFAVRKGDDRVKEVKSLDQLCGLKIGTGAGTTFEATLERESTCARTPGNPSTRCSASPTPPGSSSVCSSSTST